jgi:hypothetical protein
MNLHITTNDSGITIDEQNQYNDYMSGYMSFANILNNIKDLSIKQEGNVYQDNNASVIQRRILEQLLLHPYPVQNYFGKGFML